MGDKERRKGQQWDTVGHSFLVQPFDVAPNGRIVYRGPDVNSGTGYRDERRTYPRNRGKRG